MLRGRLRLRGGALGSAHSPAIVTVLQGGHQLVATARDPRSLDDLVAAHGDRILPLALDVTDADSPPAAIASGTERFGRIDVVINNPGYADLAAIEDVTLEDFRRQIDTNLFGVVNVTKAALPLLREQGAGHIIQVSSIGGRLATAGLSAYQSAKWAVGGFSSVLAAEVAPLGIRVTVLEPGGMQTDWPAHRCTSHPSLSPTARPSVRWRLCTTPTRSPSGIPPRSARLSSRSPRWMILHCGSSSAARPTPTPLRQPAPKPPLTSAGTS